MCQFATFRKVEHLQQLTQEETSLRKKKLAILRVKIRHKKMENDRLEKTVGKLQDVVTSRETVAEIQRGGVLKQKQDAEIKMQRIAERRQLMDIANAQKQEIRKLKTERERLRAKTFPTFVQLQVLL